MHIYQTKIKLHETDAAGVLFFTNQLKLIHDAYEALFESIGFGLAEIISEKDFFVPIVHSESDHKAPLTVGNVVEIQTIVERVGKTSFTLAYSLLNHAQEVVGTAKTVHVAVDKQTRKKIPLPADLHVKLKDLLPN